MNDKIRIQDIYKKIHKPKENNNEDYKEKTKYQYELGIDYFEKTNNN